MFSHLYQTQTERPTSPFDRSSSFYNRRHQNQKNTHLFNRSGSFIKSRQKQQISQKRLQSFQNLQSGPLREIDTLLSSQRMNIKRFKGKIDIQKKKVQEDFGALKKQLQCILDDTKLSVQAKLDEVYMSYIQKYALFKNEAHKLKVNRKVLVQQSEVLRNFRNGNTSNSGLYGDLEEDYELINKQYEINQINSKSAIQKLDEIAKQIIIFGEAQCNFYKKPEMIKELEFTKEKFKSDLRIIHTQMDNYVLSLPQLFQRAQNAQSSYTSQIKSQYYENIRSQQGNNSINHQLISRDKINLPKTNVCDVSQQQNIVINDNIQKINLTKSFSVETDHTDSILCVCFIGKYIATGSKDHNINIYDLKGTFVRKLRAHQSSICCLSTFKSIGGQLLASGSDHGCSSVVLWNPQNWGLRMKKQYHSAALSAILDMKDTKTIITGGYDKKINLINAENGELTFTIGDLKSPVVAMVLTHDSRKIICSLLDNTLLIFGVQRSFNVTTSLKFIRVINCESLVCSLKSLTIQPNIIVGGTKDGKIRTYDSESGMMISSSNVDEAAIIELAIIQSTNSNPSTLSCSSKSYSLTQSELFGNKINEVHLQGKLKIQFGCGVGPKIVFDREGRVAIINQSSIHKEFTIYNLNTNSSRAFRNYNR